MYTLNKTSEIPMVNPKKQGGATFITWMIVAGFAVLVASAIVKVAPYYVEHYNVQKFMKVLASERNAKTMNKRQVFAKVEKYLNINSLYGLEQAYYDSRDRSKHVDNPFTLKKMKKGKNRQMLSVHYKVPVKWIGNLSFLIDFKHSVVMGEPNFKVKEVTKHKK
jgi:hypothetical protein